MRHSQRYQPGYWFWALAVAAVMVFIAVLWLTHPVGRGSTVMGRRVYISHTSRTLEEGSLGLAPQLCERKSSPTLWLMFLVLSQWLPQSWSQEGSCASRHRAPAEAEAQATLFRTLVLSFFREASPADFRFVSLTRACPWPPSAAREARIERFHLLVSAMGDDRRVGLRITEEATVSRARSARSLPGRRSWQRCELPAVRP